MKRFFIPAFFILLCNNLFSQAPVNPLAIDIVRDSFGVPNIFAKADAEVAYVLAWAPRPKLILKVCNSLYCR